MTYEIVSERKARYPIKITSPNDAYYALKRYARQKQEHFIVLTLTGAHEVISVTIVSIGLLNRTVVHPREVFHRAIKDSAAAVIVAHNHPSGQLEPSEEDRMITKRLTDAGEIIGIPILDHIIFTRNGFVSFKDLGLIA
jgi:DNA repair protein RadC